jgi:hypothetical protein
MSLFWDMGKLSSAKKKSRLDSAPVIIAIAVTAERALVALVEAVAVVVNCPARNGWVSETSVTVCIRPTASRKVVTPGIEPVVKTTLREALVVCGRILPGVIRPVMLGAARERQGKNQYSKSKCFTHNLPSIQFGPTR